MQVKALACELPHQHGLPLSRYSGRDLAREVTRRGLVAKHQRTHHLALAG
jgi:hypothetical protein